MAKRVQKKCQFMERKSDTFFVQKRTSFFSPKIAESHFFSVSESPAYISANRVGNFFHIEKRTFFHKNSVKFPTHFPDMYAEYQKLRGSLLLQHFCVQNSVQKVFKKMFQRYRFFFEEKSPFFSDFFLLHFLKMKVHYRDF